MLEPVVQEEATGCGIASVANILGKTYSEMKAVANAMGIHAPDKSLWSDTQYVRRMLSSAGVKTSADETPFESWEALPNLALLSIKHHQEEGKDFWHWVVFKRVGGQPFVLDSASYLSLLQKAHCVGGFLRREAKAEGAGGHFWHDAVTKPNIITPAP